MNTNRVLRGDDFVWYVGEEIGEGRFGVVSLATDENGREVAVKMLKSEYAEDELAVRRLLRELAAMRELHHPAFPKVFGQGVSEYGTPFFVMELIHGESLESVRLRQGGRIPVELGLSLARQALDALEYVHAIGWLHRDINPRNLFLASDGDLRVMDLGLCRAIERSGVLATSTGPTLLGTPGFIAPEQARSNWNNVDERSDIWSLGATLFVLLSGQSVHPGKLDEQIRAAMFAQPRSIRQVAPDLPDQITEWIDRALAFDPEFRWASATVMKCALREIRSVTERQIAVAPSLVSSFESFPMCQATADRTIVHAPDDQDVVTLRLVHSPDFQTRRDLRLARDALVTLGRDPNLVTWCINDQLISRTHASIQWSNEDECYRLVDRASRNGVEVNGMRCNTSKLQSGDVIRIGESLLVLVDEAASSTLTRTIEEIARNSHHLLLIGESGVGREHLARCIHKNSGRLGAFVPVDCAALDHDLGVPHLFGFGLTDPVEPGAARTGLLQAAEQGTLFLNEIPDLPTAMQSLLSRALRRGRVRPLGGAMEFEMDVRVIATVTTAAEGVFPADNLRLDLYAVLADQKLYVPALRRRRHEILSILADIAKSDGLKIKFTADAAEAVLLEDWPANICGLRQLIARISREQGPVSVVDLPTLRNLESDVLTSARLQKDAPANPSTKLETGRAVLHRRPSMERLLRNHNGNVARAAKELNVPRMEIYRAMKKLGIDVTSMRETR